MSGCVYLLLDSDVCGKFNAMWNYGLFTLIVTVLAPVLGSTYVMVTKDIHYDRSVILIILFYLIFSLFIFSQIGV